MRASLLVLCGLTVLLVADPVRANAELRRELGVLANEIKAVLDKQQQESIAIQFSGPANFPGSAGPGLVQVLSEELQKLGVAVKVRAALGLEGRYHVTELVDENDRMVKLLAVEITARVVDSFGKELVEFPFKRTIRSESAILQLVGPSVELPSTPSVAAPNRERDRAIRNAFANPKPAIAGTEILAARDSRFAVEVLVDGKARTPEDRDGLAFVPIRKDEVYAVRISNKSTREMAVDLAIDGLNLFTFTKEPEKLSDGRPNPRAGQPTGTRAVLVGPGQSVVIHGWPRDLTTTDRFKVTDYATSAAATLNQPAQVGTITATFAAAWVGEPPADETPAKKGLGTGFGPSVDQKYVSAPRTVGGVRATVSVRYTR